MMVRHVSSFVGILLKLITIYTVYKYFVYCKKSALKHVEILFLVVFILLMILLSPLFGGPAFGAGERPEMMFQLVPAFLLLMYLMATKIEYKTREAGILKITLLVIFCGSVFTNFSITTSYLTYKGPIYSADVPPIFKEQVSDYLLAKKNGQSDILNIIYDVDGYWAEILKIGRYARPEFPNIYNVGIFFDYLLKKRGVAIQKYEKGCLLHNRFFLISYSTSDELICDNYSVIKTEIGNYNVFEYKKMDGS